MRMATRLRAWCEPYNRASISSSRAAPMGVAITLSPRRPHGGQ